jgi:hypothetical protein
LAIALEKSRVGKSCSTAATQFDQKHGRRRKDQDEKATEWTLKRIYLQHLDPAGMMTFRRFLKQMMDPCHLGLRCKLEWISSMTFLS